MLFVVLTNNLFSINLLILLEVINSINSFYWFACSSYLSATKMADASFTAEES